MTSQSAARYTRTAIVFHWLIFVLVACGFALAVYMSDLKFSPIKLKYISWHKWIGVTVFALAVMRLGWRLTHRPPALPVSLPSWQRRAAALTHALLYALLLVIPLTGWLYSSAAGVPTVYLGAWQIPDLLARDKALADVLKQVHFYLNYTLLAVVILHGAAALRHHLLDCADILARMLPFLKPRVKSR